MKISCCFYFSFDTKSLIIDTFGCTHICKWISEFDIWYWDDPSLHMRKSRNRFLSQNFHVVLFLCFNYSAVVTEVFMNKILESWTHWLISWTLIFMKKLDWNSFYEYDITRSLRAPPEPNFRLAALWASLILSFAPFGLSVRVTNTTVCHTAILLYFDRNLFNLNKKTSSQSSKLTNTFWWQFFKEGKVFSFVLDP